MQIHQLEQFCAIARIEHMTKAAAELHVSQPTLSLNISRLEDELGTELFDRSGRNIRLNEYGKTFLYHVERILDELETAKQEVRSRVIGDESKIRFADALLNNTYNIISDYMEINPNARFNHQTATLPEVRSLLENGSIDLAVAVLSPDYDFGKYIQWAPVMRTRLMVVMPEDHPLAGQKEIPLTKLKDEALMYAVNGFDARDAFDRYCLKAGFEPRYVYSAIKPFLFNDLSRQHGYLSIISEEIWNNPPSPLIKNESGTNYNYTRKDGLVGAVITEPECLIDYGILSGKGHYNSKAVREFKVYLSDYLRYSLSRL